MTISARAPYLFWTGTLPGVSSRPAADTPITSITTHHHTPSHIFVIWVGYLSAVPRPSIENGFCMYPIAIS
ncbi:hypothetical protein F5Y18DRAFT_373906 [Xylariaceae sp. FL1019]|nr:hypothetical protein F5Y18DRAFT_373906 [Xylariaceae sp. FL1019]